MEIIKFVLENVKITQLITFNKIQKFVNHAIKIVKVALAHTFIIVIVVLKKRRKISLAKSRRLSFVLRHVLSEPILLKRILVYLAMKIVRPVLDQIIIIVIVVVMEERMTVQIPRRILSFVLKAALPELISMHKIYACRVMQNVKLAQDQTITIVIIVRAEQKKTLQVF